MVNGFLFQVGDTTELACIMTRIAKNPHILNELRKNIVSPSRVEEEALQ